MDPTKKSDEDAVVRGKRYTSEDIHKAIFRKKPKKRTLAELKEGVSLYIRQKYKRP